MSERPLRPERGHQWLGAHLFFEGEIYSEVCDRVLLEVVAPLVEGLTVDGSARRWFFIRYREGGSHVRLRILGPAAWLADAARPSIEQAAGAALPLVRRLAFVEYEPEVERYGGPHGVVLAEKLFHHSSVAALALLRKIDAGDRPARFGKGLLAMLVLLQIYAGGRHASADMTEHYGTGYLRAQVPDPRQQELWMEAFAKGFNRQADHLADYIEAAWAALEAGDALTPELDFYRDRMREVEVALRALFDGGRLFGGGKVVGEWRAVLYRVVSTYLHMMNNRLGVSIREECYLSVLISRILGEVAQMDV